jgi:hypothetical protein
VSALQKTKAQERAIERLKKKIGPVVELGVEPDGQALRVRIAGWEAPEERERIIRPSGLVEEPVA